LAHSGSAQYANTDAAARCERQSLQGQLRSGGRRSIPRRELTLTARMPTLIIAASEAMNVSEALSSSHQNCHIAGSSWTTSP
jgi:hypothetical protein